ncbi:MAG TPA: ATP-binding cassette domain-containing protein [Azospirillaceae bacterium]|nr:ATP-binding cassette domain-containing protein [Azospirillaceae bacterium]
MALTDLVWTRPIPFVEAEPSILPLALERVSFAPAGLPLIDDLSLNLTAGSRTVVLGPNGAGKSLLLRLCHGLIVPTRGRVTWGGVGNGHPRHAMVFQRPVMLRRSVAANVEHALKLRGLPGRRERAAVALERTGLAPLARRPARLLSGGEQQRLALARAWALEPQVLFLDEPTASLDPAATQAVEAIIEVIASAGTKIVLTTHDLGQARRLADEVVFLHRGRLVEHAPAAGFFRRPASPEARAFLEGRLAW